MTRSVKSSREGEPTGCQEPSVRLCPEYSETDGQDAVDILRLGGFYPDEWQENILNDWMARNNFGWVASVCGLSVPRQNGKTTDVSGRASAGMVLYGEWVIYTAHLQKTATETFMELKGLFESQGLKKYVKEIKSAIGREQIILNNGGKIQFVARTRNGGRGLHGDVLIFDEAQELTIEQQASFIPAISASKNPQTIYLGTPPDDNVPGDVFGDIRNRAKDSEKISWIEYSVEDIGDVEDKARWYKTNPALGIRIKESTVETECHQMPPKTFARERLGWWQPKTETHIDYALDKDAWLNCKSESLKPEGKTAYGVKFSPDGSFVSLCGAVIDDDDKARISLIEHQSTSNGVRWLSDWLNERYAKACCVVIDGRNGVDVLVDRLSEKWVAKSSIIRPGVKDVIASVSLLTEEVNENTLSWYYGQEILNDSAVNAIKRPLGGGYGFGGDNSSPIEAAALALYGVRTSKRNPTAKMRIG